MDRRLQLVGLALLTAFALLLSRPARAYNADVDYPLRSEYSANRSITNFTHVTSGQSYVKGPNGVSIGRDFVMKAPNRNVSARAVATVSNAAAKRIAARALGYGIPGVGAALLIHDLYEAVRVQAGQCGLDNLCFDPGTLQETITQYCYTLEITACADTKALVTAAIANHLDNVNYAMPADLTTVDYQDVAYQAYTETAIQRRFLTATRACGTCPWGAASWGAWQHYTSINPTLQNGLVCPVDGTGQRPPVDWDGKCPTGQFGEAISFEEAAAKHDSKFGPNVLPYTDQQLEDMVEAALGFEPYPYTPSAGIDLSVDTITPSTINQPTTTQTLADGTTVSTATAFAGTGKCLGYGLANPCTANSKLYVDWTETTTKTTTTPGGSSTTETTVKNPAPIDPTEAASPETAASAPTDCDKYPSASGCTPLVGAAGIPAAPALETKVIPLEITPFGAFGPSSGSCPADRPLDLNIGSFALSWGPVCQLADGIRPIVVGLAWLAAVFGFVGLSNKGD